MFYFIININFLIKISIYHEFFLNNYAHAKIITYFLQIQQIYLYNILDLYHNIIYFISIHHHNYIFIFQNYL